MSRDTKQLSEKLLIDFLEKRFSAKVNESQYIAFFVFSGSIKKLFSIDCVNVYLFSVFVSFPLDFARWKGMRSPNTAYIVIH